VGADNIRLFGGKLRTIQSIVDGRVALVEDTPKRSRA
jgi:hypothetical protein